MYVLLNNAGFNILHVIAAIHQLNTKQELAIICNIIKSGIDPYAQTNKGVSASCIALIEGKPYLRDKIHRSNRKHNFLQKK